MPRTAMRTTPHAGGGKPPDHWVGSDSLPAAPPSGHSASGSGTPVEWSPEAGPEPARLDGPLRRVPIKLPSAPLIADLRSAVGLAAQATEGVTDIVDDVHRSVLRTFGLGGTDGDRSGGVSGLVYSSIRAVTRGSGLVADRALAMLQTVAPASPVGGAGSAHRHAVIAALNGVLGDRLAAAGNPLATPMALRLAGRVIDRQRPPAAAEVGGRLLVMIHGLCMNDLQWRHLRDGKPTDHGSELATALGYTPLYLRYNSGLHVAENGRLLSGQLEQLVNDWPRPIERLTLLTHSMGGLLARSALQVASEQRHAWRGRLDDLVFLGTPHHGAPLERLGNLVGGWLGATAYSAPFQRLGQLRSAGITDLRHGCLLDSHWHGRDRFDATAPAPAVLPLPDDVACYTVAATTAARRGRLLDQVGDGLVPLDSALGRHREPARQLDFNEDAQWIAYRTGHLELLRSAAVGNRLQQWLRRH